MSTSTWAGSGPPNDSERAALWDRLHLLRGSTLASASRLEWVVHVLAVQVSASGETEFEGQWRDVKRTLAAMDLHVRLRAQIHDVSAYTQPRNDAAHASYLLVNDHVVRMDRRRWPGDRATRFVTFDELERDRDVVRRAHEASVEIACAIDDADRSVLGLSSLLRVVLLERE